MKQRTISKPFTLSGPGLHTGNKTTITFEPAPVGTGVVFIREDLPSKPRIHVDFPHIMGVTRGTTIGTREVHIHTVEHVLSALSGMGVDNVFVHINSTEPPVLDGSAKLYVEAIQKSGIVEQTEGEKEYLELKNKIEYVNGSTSIVAEPSDKLLEINYTIEYEYPSIGVQSFSLEVTPDNYRTLIAPARTFCLDYEVEALHSRGYGKGGDLSNTVVFGVDKVHTDLRFPDEPVRHKILDMIGDLFLLGRPLKARITARKSGHSHNINFLKKLVSETSNGRTLPSAVVASNGEERIKEESKMSQPQTQPEIKIGVPLNSVEIQKIIPHRYPFLMIDKVVIEEAAKRAVGYKAVSGNEPFFQGHFPGSPIMPGVLIVEALAQTSCVLFLSRPDLAGKLAYFMGIEKVKFRKPVLPGDYLELRVEVLKAKERFGKVKGEALVGGAVVTEAEFSFVLVDRQ